MLLGTVAFAVLYPLGFWLHAGVTITRSFHRFNLGLCLVLVALAGGFLRAAGDADGALLAWGWVALLTGVMTFFWGRERVHAWAVTLPSLVGAVLYAHVVERHVPGWTWAAGIASLLGGGITALTFYATALGHWYLETRGLVPLRFLTRAVRLLTALLGLRLLWTAAQLAMASPALRGEPVGWFVFMTSLEGFLLPVGILMGTVTPLVLMLLVLGTLRARSTTSATGILYAACVCALIGDAVHRYYLLAHGFAL